MRSTFKVLSEHQGMGIFDGGWNDHRWHRGGEQREMDIVQTAQDESALLNETAGCSLLKWLYPFFPAQHIRGGQNSTESICQQNERVLFFSLGKNEHTIK